MLFDTHIHLDDERYDPDRDELLSSMNENGISYILTPGVNLESSRACLEIARKYSFVFSAAGIHPHEADNAEAGDYDALIELAKDPKVRAIGEIGLDYHYDFSPRDRQKEVLLRQLDIAQNSNLPVLLHDREAHQDMLRILQEYKGRGVIHCYSGSLEMAKELVKLGYYISFTGVITFNNAQKFENIIKWIPDDRIMIETDGPYLTPVPYRGKRNDSRYLKWIAEKIAEIKGITFEETAELTTKNAVAFFDI